MAGDTDVILVPCNFGIVGLASLHTTILVSYTGEYDRLHLLCFMRAMTSRHWLDEVTSLQKPSVVGLEIYAAEAIYVSNQPWNARGSLISKGPGMHVNDCRTLPRTQERTRDCK